MAWLQSGGIKVIFNGAECSHLAAYWVVSEAQLPSKRVSQRAFREYLEMVARKDEIEALNPFTSSARELKVPFRIYAQLQHERSMSHFDSDRKMAEKCPVFAMLRPD